MNVVILVAAVGVWGAIHSWLASMGVKERSDRMVGKTAGRAYRLAYNGFAVVSFLPILWLMRVLPDRTLYFVESPWRYLMLAGEAAGVVLLLMALLATDPLHFAGLRQLVEGDGSSRLVTGGFYRWVRHPLYFFGLAILWLTPIMTINMLGVIAVLTVYIIAGAALEERKLLREFGDDYRAYRERTPMLIPGLHVRRRSAEPRQGSGST